MLNSKEFRWLGQFDNVINSGGIKIMPEEVEQSIARLVTKTFCISSIPHEKLGETVVLVVEAEMLLEDEKSIILDQIEKLVHPYEMPKCIYTLTPFPKTDTGKIDRRAL